MPKVPTHDPASHPQCNGHLRFTPAEAAASCSRIEESEERIRTLQEECWEMIPLPNEQGLIRSFADLALRHPSLREPVVEGIARIGEVVNVIAPSKVGKTILAWGLALAIAAAPLWLGRFKTRKGRVLIIDNELHPETIVFRGQAVAKALKLSTDGIDVLNLRGQLMDYQRLSKEVIRYVPATKYIAIIVDSHYRMLPDGVSENDNSKMAGVYNLIDSMADHTQAAWWLIHHSTKGDQGDKGITDVGAGAGAQARAADSHLILRKHGKEPNGYILQAGVRSFPPLAPVGLRFQWPVWTPDDSLDTANLESQETRKRAREDQAGHQKLLKALAGSPGLSCADLMKRVGMGYARCQRLLDEMVQDGQVEAKDGERSGNKTTLYRVTEGDAAERFRRRLLASRGLIKKPSKSP